MNWKFKAFLVVVGLCVAIYLDHKYFHILNHVGIVHGCANGACK